MQNKVFLGGTCNNSTWRNKLIPFLKIDFFNPVVEDWTPECQEKEIEEKKLFCNIHLYIITKEMKGVFSIAEVIDSVKTKGKITILHIIPEGFDNAELKSLIAVSNMVILNGGISYVDNELERTARVLNYCFK